MSASVLPPRQPAPPAPQAVRPLPGRGVWPLIATLVRAEWRHHPWRQAAAVIAVALGVALGFAVQLINGSALAEFDTAVHAASGAPDLSLKATGGLPFDEAIYPVVAKAAPVARASPVVEIAARLRAADGRLSPITVLGLDALVAPAISPGWLPQPAAGADPRATLDPDAVFLNPAALALVGAAGAIAPQDGAAGDIVLQAGGRTQTLRVAGRVATEGPPLAVIDIAGAQTHFGRLGQLTRIDVRLAPGATAADLMAALPAGSGLRGAAPDESALRMAQLSQSYRVNLSVLALVALFTGAFLVFSVQSLAVAKRMPQLALLGVLGLSARDRRHLVWADSLGVGGLGALLGLALGTGLAAAALAALGGDLGSGLLGSAAPRLHWSAGAALAYGGLGIAAAFAGGWWPARAAEAIAPAQGLKGLSSAPQAAWPAAGGVALIGLSAGLALLPAWGAIPWAAYASVAALLLGGIALVPQAVDGLLRGLAGSERPVIALAVARAVDQRHTATAAVAGVVSSLALVVALTVMVTSFRGSLADWLQQVLPADLYLRPAGADGRGEPAWVAPAVLAALAGDPQVRQWRAQRLAPLEFGGDTPTALLMARDAPRPGGGGASTDAEGGPDDLPWVDAPRGGAADDGALAIYPSEVMAALHHLRRGDRLRLPLPAPAGTVDARVAGIWRDYARQQGAVVIDRRDWLRLTHDDRVSDVAIWLAPGASAGVVATLGRRLQQAAPAGDGIDVATPGEIRALSLRIFDRSFAVTRWLQAVAMAIGLAGIAASFSAQVLARRREFGTLRHLGFTRRQVLGLVAAEGALWTGVGAALGLVLGLAVSAVLVEVVNPQSFHWTMRWQAPPGPLAGLAIATVLAGALTAFIAGRAAASPDMARAVKEDW